MNYGLRFVTLYSRQGSRPSPWKINAKKQNGCLGRPYKFIHIVFSKIYLTKASVLVAPSCLTLCDPLDCSPPGSSVHRILQARILERVAIYFSRGSSRPRDQAWVSCIVDRFFTIWATREDQTNIVSNGERQLFSLRLGIRQGFSLSTLLFNIVLEVTNIAVRQKKKKDIKVIMIRNDKV